MATAVYEKQEAAAVDPRAGKYLTFCLGREEFAVRVLHVREIIGIQDITTVPQTPACIKGVINLRGKVIPVVDLRLKFGLPEQAHTERTCIIVIQVEGESGSVNTGMIVDEVSEVLNLNGSEIEPTPDFGDGVPTPCLLGLAKVKDKVKILLDIGQVLRDPDLAGLRSVMS
jgi:purine-binding chemotaxis protein CheW